MENTEYDHKLAQCFVLQPKEYSPNPAHQPINEFLSKTMFNYDWRGFRAIQTIEKSLQDIYAPVNCEDFESELRILDLILGKVAVRPFPAMATEQSEPAEFFKENLDFFEYIGNLGWNSGEDRTLLMRNDDGKREFVTSALLAFYTTSGADDWWKLSKDSDEIGKNGLKIYLSENFVPMLDGEERQTSYYASGNKSVRLEQAFTQRFISLINAGKCGARIAKDLTGKL